MRSTSRAFAGRILHLVSAAALAASSLRAQPVNDGATNTLSNVTTNFTGDVTVGTHGSVTLLILSDNARQRPVDQLSQRGHQSRRNKSRQ